MPPKNTSQENWVKNRKDVQDLEQSVQNLTKTMEGWLRSVRTSGDAYKTIVDNAKKLSGVLSNSKKKTEKSNDLAKNQTKVAQIGLSFGKKQNVFRKVGQEFQLRRLKNTRKQQDFEDKVTDKMINQIETQRQTVNYAEQLNKLAGGLSGLLGEAGQMMGQAMTNPLAFAITLMTMFDGMTGKIGDKFGAMGVTKFRDDLAGANIEYTKMGLEGETSLAVIESLNKNFAIGTDEAIKMSIAVGDVSKSLGISTDQAATLVGYFETTTDLTGEGAANLLKQADSLAVANDVAPGVVMEDIANNTEVFAKFGASGTKNIMRAAIQARKLGISLDKVANTAESMLNFQDSLNAEVEASIMLGRNVNLQRARELSLAGDMEGLTSEIRDIVGDEAAWNEMNVLQRQSLAKAVGMQVADLDKMVRKQRESATITGLMAQQDLSKIIPEEAMGKMAKTFTQLKADFMLIAEEVGPSLIEIFQSVAKPVIGMVKGFAGIVKSIDESIGLATALKVIFGLMAVKAIVTGIAAIYTSFNQIPLGLGLLGAIAAASAFKGVTQSVGDSFSQAPNKGGGHMITTAEGKIFQGTRNDDALLGPFSSMNGNGGGDKSAEIAEMKAETRKTNIKLDELIRHTERSSVFISEGSLAKSIGAKVADSMDTQFG